MRILLDTNVFLWILIDDKRLSVKARNLYLDEANKLFLSIASIWEIFVKIGIGKLTLTENPEKFMREQLEENGIDLLPITFEHVSGLLDLPPLHKDPFDRLIIAQAIHEKLPVLSSDASFSSYAIQNLF